MLFAQHYGEIHYIGPVSSDCARHRSAETVADGSGDRHPLIRVARAKPARLRPQLSLINA
jgi:hypothetical protein